MSDNKETTLWTKSRCHGSEDFHATARQLLFLSYFNRLIKLFSQGAPVSVGETKVCCCSHTGQHDNEIWGKAQQKSPLLDTCRVFHGPWQRKGTSMDCDLGALRVPLRGDPLVALVVSVPVPVWFHLLPGVEPPTSFLAGLPCASSPEVLAALHYSRVSRNPSS